MSQSTAGAGEPWTALRREIDAIVSRELRARVISDALSLAGLRGPPQGAEALRAFVSGPLFLSLASVLGPQEATDACARIKTRLRATIPPTGDDSLQSDDPEPTTGVRLNRIALAKAQGQASAGPTLLPPPAAMRAVAFVGPEALRAALGRSLQHVGACLLQPGADEAPDLIVVHGLAEASLGRARATARRWGGVTVLAWCADVGAGPPPPGVVVLPLPETASEEVARVCKAHLDAKRAV